MSIQNIRKSLSNSLLESSGKSIFWDANAQKALIKDIQLIIRAMYQGTNPLIMEADPIVYLKVFSPTSISFTSPGLRESIHGHIDPSAGTVISGTLSFNTTADPEDPVIPIQGSVIFTKGPMSGKTWTIDFLGKADRHTLMITPPLSKSRKFIARRSEVTKLLNI